MSDFTPEMIAHRDRMERLMNACCDAERGTPERDRANAEYDAALAQGLQDHPEWECCILDPDTYSLYSDLSKEIHGFRFRGPVTVTEAKQAIARWIKEAQHA